MFRAHAAYICLALTVGGASSASAAVPGMGPAFTRPMDELRPAAVIRVGATADWVAITSESVWVGSTGPTAVHRIDPRTNQLVASVELPGEPCAGLAVGFGSLWVPLCGKPARLAKVDASRNALEAVFQTGPAAAEGGVTTSADSVWLVTNKEGVLARLDPATGAIRQSIQIAAGSYNPRYDNGVVWVTRAEGGEITAVDAVSGKVLGTTRTGPGPRFLTSGAGSIWTLNQGDGSLTRVDAHSRSALHTIPLGTPGHGGDIAYGGGLIWTTMVKVPLSAIDPEAPKLLCQWVGPGGDSLGIGHNAIWLTDYHGGTVSRLELHDVVSHCSSAPQVGKSG